MDQQRVLIIAELILGTTLLGMFLADPPIWGIATVLVLFLRLERIEALHLYRALHEVFRTRNGGAA